MLKQAFLKGGSITFISRILGFIRDIVMARYLGASWQLDAFLIAFKLPNFFRRLFAEGVFTQVLLPTTVSAKNTRFFLSNVYGLLCLILFAVSFPFILLPDQILTWVLYGMQKGPTFQLAVSLLPILFPYLFCISACGFFNVQLNIKEQFTLGFSVPLLLNGMLIFGVLCFNGDVVYLSYCVLVSGLLQFSILSYAVFRQGGVVVPIWPQLDASIKGLLKRSSKAFLGQLLMYVSANIDLFLVSFLSAGSLSWLYYTDRLIYLPVGVVSVTLASVLMPKLSLACHQKQYKLVGDLLSKGLMLCVCLSIPMVITVLLFAEEIVGVLFQSSSFTTYDIQSTAISLRIAAMALPALMINRVWMGYFFADQKIDFQVMLTCCSVVVSTVVCVIYLSHLGHAALTLGMLAGSWVQCVGSIWYTFRLLRFNCKYQLIQPFLNTIVGVVILYLVMSYGFPKVQSRVWLMLALLIKGGAPFMTYCYWNASLLSWCVQPPKVD